jgi:hypothetical protein
MKNHLPTLKKFTYGKHIVARVEKMLYSATVGKPKRNTAETSPPRQ